MPEHSNENSQSNPLKATSMSTLNLTPEHRNLLVDLVVIANEPKSSAVDQLEQTTGTVELLTDALIRVLADWDYREAWTAKLIELQPDLPIVSPLSAEELNEVVQYGPSSLTLDRLFELALSPCQTATLHDDITETLSGFWLDAIESAMQASASERGVTRTSTAELVAEVHERLRGDSEQSTDAKQVEMASFDAAAGLLSESKEAPVIETVILNGFWKVVGASGIYDQVTKQKEITAIARFIGESVFLQLRSLPVATENSSWTVDSEPLESNGSSVVLPDAKSKFLAGLYCTLGFEKKRDDGHLNAEIRLISDNNTSKE